MKKAEIIMFYLFLLLWAVIVIFYAFGAAAHDNEPTHDQWYRDLKQPDNPSVPCCGLADAYWADVVRVRDGRSYAVVTDDREDAPLGRHHVPLGKEIEIPKEKLKWDAGNPTGHAVIFLNINDVAMCYVQGSGI